MLGSSRKDRLTLFLSTIPGASRVAPIKKGNIDFKRPNNILENPYRSFETLRSSHCSSWSPEQLS